VRRYVTIHPVGHEPADSLVLAGVIRAVWAVHEVPLALHPEADGSITVADLPAPTLQVVQGVQVEPDEDQDEPAPPAPKPSPASTAPGTPRRATAGTKPATAPATPGAGVDPGPMSRRPFNPDAARLRAAGEV